MRIRSLVLTGAILASGFAPGAALAQRDRGGPAWYDSPPAYSPYGARGRAYCQKLCNLDMSPCDPPEFKRADGRCTAPGTGRL